MGWHAIKATATGASHTRSGLPNQDAIQSWEDPQLGALALAIADGHGSSKCFRSDRGAALAVRKAVEAVKEFCSFFYGETLSDPSLGQQILFIGLLTSWEERFDNDLRERLSATLTKDLGEYIGRLDKYAQTGNKDFARIIQEVAGEYFGRDSQTEVFNKQELRQLRDLTTQVLEDFLQHQSWSTKPLDQWHLADNLLEKLLREWHEDKSLHAASDRASQEILKQSLRRRPDQTRDPSFRHKPNVQVGFQDPRRTTIDARNLSSLIRGWLGESLLETWRDALPGIPTIEIIGGTWLTRCIVEKWTEAVNEDVEHQAFTDEEFDKIRGNPPLAYGTTLLTVLVTTCFILYMQLGDGDILNVSETGEVARPIARDTNLIANETYSLCLPNAWKLFRLKLQPISERPPAMIMLSTDGYSNSYKTEDDFFRVGKDILDIARTAGKAAIDQDLGTWLKETSAHGSGDDITFGAIFREDVLRLPDGADEHSPDQAEETVPRDPEETGNANILS
jgi:serine/threonine protein phosphatase PrpC